MAGEANGTGKVVFSDERNNSVFLCCWERPSIVEKLMIQQVEGRIAEEMPLNR